MCLKLNIHNLIKEGNKLTFMWIPSHIGIQGNEIADSLAKEALNLQIDNRLTPKLPYSDFRPKIKEYTLSLWKKEWKKEAQNKLLDTKPKLKPRNSLNLSRRENVIITRLKIGHTKLTHQYLFLNKQAPKCIKCDCPLTVKHILLKCIEFSETRSKYYKTKNP